MEPPEFQSSERQAVCNTSEALFALRDALVDLSLCLKDWQFETDLERRKSTDLTVSLLLDKVSSARGSSL